MGCIPVPMVRLVGMHRTPLNSSGERDGTLLLAENRPRIALKSMGDPVDPERDGLRVLAERHRGRGGDHGKYNVWMASLGPSEGLLRDWAECELDAGSYLRRYREELLLGGEIDQRNTTVKNHGQKFTLRLLRELGLRRELTLVGHGVVGREECHLGVLREMIEQSAP
jgi:uncharacterized protein YeaO (DUF488 family)